VRNHVQRAFLSTILLGASALQVANADATLLGFDEPNRNPDVYIVVLNESLPWHRKLTDSPGHSDDPEADKANSALRNAALQADAQLVDSIAKELATRYHGVLRGEIHTVGRGFIVKMSESDVRQMAKDPRIASITADHVIGSVWGNQ
jgi:hypothetical protein